MRIMFDMFLFAFWVFSTQKHVVVIFTKFDLACVHARQFKHLEAPILVRAHAPCTMHASHMPNMTSHGLAYNVNHIIMMSSAFTFHSCYVGMRWHDVIGVHLA